MGEIASRHLSRFSLRPLITARFALEVHTMAMIRRKFGGLEAQKFQFDIVIGEMRGPSKLAGQELNVCWTRGAKIASTAHVKCSEAGAATWNETLSLICTMYRSSNGKYQEKKAKLAVREKKKKKTVGKVHFDLADYIAMEGSKQVTMPLEVSAGVFSSNEAAGSLSLTVGCRFIPPGDAGEYSEMTAMDASEMSNSSDLCDEDEGEDPVPVGAPQKATSAQVAAIKNTSASKGAGGSGWMDGLTGASADDPENSSLRAEIDQLKTDNAKVKDDLEGANDEVKRLRKVNYNLQDSIARQEGDGGSAELEMKITTLEAQLHTESIAKAALEEELRWQQQEGEPGSLTASAPAPAEEDDDQIDQLIGALVEAKMAYANSE